MRCVAEPSGSLPVLRLAVFATIAVAGVSCSSESSRLTDPFNSRGSSGEVTGSVVPKTRADTRTVQSQPLPPPQASAPATRPAPVASAPMAPVAARPSPGYTWEGGTAITVATGESGQTLAQRYGVPATEIARANGLPDAAAIKPGQRIVIPRHDGSVVTGSVNRPMAPAPVAPRPAPLASAPVTTGSVASGGQHVHVVGPGDTLMKLSRQYKKSVTEIARANNIPPHTLVKMGDRIVIPGVRAQTPVAWPKQAATTQPPRQIASVPAQAPAPVVQAQPAPRNIAANNPPPAATPPLTTARISPAAEEPAPQKSKADTAGAMPSFRWPVRGRVIAAYGSKPSGQQNDGINVAVPEGTPVKAAEDGVVVYANNELKTYGNLVLVRHSNGYVTAYAHASEILVKRDEPVKRGQTIAKAGQTGNVTTPQVHFEIRKGSSPVDPMPFLDRGGNT